MSISRYSSRTSKLDKDFLAKKLIGASKYKRIAGYFRSSIFELVGEEISNIPDVRIVCNSELDVNDFKIAREREIALKEKWNESTPEIEALLHNESYRKLDELLSSGRIQIRVVQKDKLFLHGKAGVIQYPNGSRISFVGSVNETKRAFAENYELIWQDDDPDSADWVDAEFEALWKISEPLPQAIIDEIHRVAVRKQVKPEELKPSEIPGAVTAEAPIYRGGEQLSPWQRSFVSLFLKHREVYGKARLLLADEVGLGKTLSMACSALVSAILDDKPILILSPSTLLYQWQTEMLDKLGIPSAVWATQKKAWISPEGKIVSPRSDYSQIKHCPYRIAIVSTGLIMHQYKNKEFYGEAGKLLENQYATVILDEAHKARASNEGQNKRKNNNLLQFMNCIASKSRNVILGTATPIQTNTEELWDLMGVLGKKADFVMGDSNSFWRNPEMAIEVITGRHAIEERNEAWLWLRNPLPPEGENLTVSQIRNENEIDSHDFEYYHDLDELKYDTREKLLWDCCDDTFFKNCNPFVRHIVLRKRKELEEQGLLEKVGVDVHPVKERSEQYMSRFDGIGISTNTPFEVAYQKAEQYCKLLGKRQKVTGFMKTLMLQRICSSFSAGLHTAQKLLNKNILTEEDENEEVSYDELDLDIITPEEQECLQEIIRQLSRPEARDPKLDTIKWFLTSFQTEGKNWLEHGCIIFSQYYDTVSWIAGELAKSFPNEPIAVYAGFGKSGLYKGDSFNNVNRDSIKAAVKNRELRIVVATDAACEGLNLQTLGTLINVDLPWNPSRLEQRLGRIKRFGQTRKKVDMLNLVYSGTQDEKIYQVLSERMKSTYDIFGSLPDSIEDEWIEDVEKLEEHINIYMSEREKAKNAFDIKYNSNVNENENRWELCSKVLSRQDIIDKLTKPW